MIDPKAPRSRKLLWLGVLLLAAAGVLGAVVPLLDCPACKGSGSLWDALKNSKREIHEGQYGDCPDCVDGKLTALKRLTR